MCGICPQSDEIFGHELTRGAQLIESNSGDICSVYDNVHSVVVRSLDRQGPQRLAVGSYATTAGDLLVRWLKDLKRVG